jgi:hypothetical protein
MTFIYIFRRYFHACICCILGNNYVHVKHYTKCEAREFMQHLKMAKNVRGEGKDAKWIHYKRKRPQIQNKEVGVYHKYWNVTQLNRRASE